MVILHWGSLLYSSWNIIVKKLTSENLKVQFYVYIVYNETKTVFGNILKICYMNKITELIFEST